MRRKFTVYGLRFSKTTFWNRINTGFLEPAVATALTACGIVTVINNDPTVKGSCNSAYRLRYCNPSFCSSMVEENGYVATALTACGIVTIRNVELWNFIGCKVATALTACGIVTVRLMVVSWCLALSCNSAYRLRYCN